MVSVRGALRGPPTNALWLKRKPLQIFENLLVLEAIFPDERGVAMQKPLFAVLALLVLAMPAQTWADSMYFEGHEPKAEHLWLPLDAKQQAAVAALPEHSVKGENDYQVVYTYKSTELNLNAEQRRLIFAATKKRLTWVFATSQSELQNDCTCGSYNTAVLESKRIAVILTNLDAQALSPRHLAAEAKRLVKRQSPRNAPKTLRFPKSLPNFQLSKNTLEIKESLRATLDTLSGADGSWLAAQKETLCSIPDPEARTLPRGWELLRINYAENPFLFSKALLDEFSDEASFTFLDERVFVVHPATATALLWPRLAARRRSAATHTTDYLIPTVLWTPIGANTPTWLLLSYRDGLLQALVLLEGKESRSGLLIDWKKSENGWAAGKALKFELDKGANATPSLRFDVRAIDTP